MFEVVISATRVGERAKMIGRRVLVNGEKQIAVAMELGMTKQRVNNIIRRLKQAASDLGLEKVERFEEAA